MLSSVYGKIDQLLIVFPGLKTDASEAEYEELVQTFDPGRAVHKFQFQPPGFTVNIAYSSFRDSPYSPGGLRPVFEMNASINVETLLKGWKQDLDELNQGHPLYYQRWIQDPFLVLQSQNYQILLQSFYNNRLSDHLLALQLAESPFLDLLLKPTRLWLEGGNMLCSRDTAFVGRDLISKNAKYFDCSRDEALSQFKVTLGIDRVISIGFEEPIAKLFDTNVLSLQPLFHIDLFMTLGGELNGRELVFWASPGLTVILLESTNRAAGIFQSDLPADRFESFDKSKSSFSNEFRLVELPIFFQEGVCYSWNNVLVEIYTGTRRVFVPTYKCCKDEAGLNPTFSVLEKEVASRFEAEGFEVVWVGTGKFFRILASHGGSLHCVTKVLRRI